MVGCGLWVCVCERERENRESVSYARDFPLLAPLFSSSSTFSHLPSGGFLAFCCGLGSGLGTGENSPLATPAAICCISIAEGGSSPLPPLSQIPPRAALPLPTPPPLPPAALGLLAGEGSVALPRLAWVLMLTCRSLSASLRARALTPEGSLAALSRKRAGAALVTRTTSGEAAARGGTRCLQGSPSSCMKTQSPPLAPLLFFFPSPSSASEPSPP